MPMSQSQRKNVFISYSHADKPWLERLQDHLKPLEREGAIDLWSDEKIHAGLKWKEEIRKALKEAKVAVLLISAKFLASDFIYTDELPTLLAAAEKEDTVILSVIISPCMFEDTESLSKYQALNSPAMPLSDLSWSEQEKVFVKVAKAIRDEIRGRADNNKQMGSREPVERTRPKEPVSEIAVPERELRTQPLDDLSEDEVKIMIKEKGYFDYELNPSGTGISHNYEIRADGKVVYDHATGLAWQQSGSDDEKPYEDAKSYIKALNRQSFAGYSDWRLPTLEEAMSLMEPSKKNGKLYIDSVFDKTQRWIWTSDLYDASSAWVVGFSLGYCFYASDIYDGYGNYVRAVR